MVTDVTYNNICLVTSQKTVFWKRKDNSLTYIMQHVVQHCGGYQRNLLLSSSNFLFYFPSSICQSFDDLR